MDEVAPSPYELMIKVLKLSNIYLPSLPQTADGRMEGWTEQTEWILASRGGRLDIYE